MLSNPHGGVALRVDMASSNQVRVGPLAPDNLFSFDMHGQDVSFQASMDVRWQALPVNPPPTFVRYWDAVFYVAGSEEPNFINFSYDLGDWSLYEAGSRHFVRATHNFTLPHLAIDAATGREVEISRWDLYENRTVQLYGAEFSGSLEIDNVRLQRVSGTTVWLQDETFDNGIARWWAFGPATLRRSVVPQEPVEYALANIRGEQPSYAVVPPDPRGGPALHVKIPPTNQVRIRPATDRRGPFAVPMNGADQTLEATFDLRWQQRPAPPVGTYRRYWDMLAYVCGNPTPVVVQYWFDLDWSQTPESDHSFTRVAHRFTLPHALYNQTLGIEEEVVYWDVLETRTIQLYDPVTQFSGVVEIDNVALQILGSEPPSNFIANGAFWQGTEGWFYEGEPNSPLTIVSWERVPAQYQAPTIAPVATIYENVGAELDGGAALRLTMSPTEQVRVMPQYSAGSLTIEMDGRDQVVEASIDLRFPELPETRPQDFRRYWDVLFYLEGASAPVNVPQQYWMDLDWAEYEYDASQPTPEFVRATHRFRLPHHVFDVATQSYAPIARWVLQESRTLQLYDLGRPFSGTVDIDNVRLRVLPSEQDLNTRGEIVNVADWISWGQPGGVLEMIGEPVNARPCNHDQDCAGARCVALTTGHNVCCDEACRAQLPLDDQIRFEATKRGDDPQRPLPLAAVWCAQEADLVDQIRRESIPGYQTTIEGGAAKLAYQLGQIDAGHHVMPTISAWIPYGANTARDYTWAIHGDYSPERELALARADREEPMTALRERRLPLTVVTTQIETLVDSMETPWARLARDDMRHCPLLPFNDYTPCLFSPFGAASNWHEVGRQWALKQEMLDYQHWYPDPPLVVYLSNNEAHRSWHWLDAMADPRGEELLGPVDTDWKSTRPGETDPNAFLKEAVGARWVELYREQQRGITENLSDGWRDQLRFIAYTSQPMSTSNNFYNSVFKPDLFTLQGCNPQQVEAGACYHTLFVDPAERTTCRAGDLLCFARCRITDRDTSDCSLPAYPRAEFAWYAEIANMSWYSSDPELAQAAHFVDESWPSGPGYDKLYTMWDGKSVSPFIGSGRDYMDVTFLMSVGFSHQERDRVLADKPDFWEETYTWSTDGEVGDVIFHQGAQAALSDPAFAHLTKERARGSSQLTLWIYRPRVVRNFDVCVGQTRLDYTGRLFEGDLEAVDAVWNNPVLRRFWQDSSLIDNPGHAQRLQTLLSLGGRNENAPAPRYWFLQTSREQPSLKAFIAGRGEFSWVGSQMDVSAIARVRGEAPYREFLVYAVTSQTQPVQDVSVSVPGFGSITVDVDPGGSFYHLWEADGRVTALP